VIQCLRSSEVPLELSESLGDAWADTTTPHGRMLTVLGGLAEFERELILARTGDGRARAMARGVKFGRPPKLTAHQRREAIQRLEDGEAQTRRSSAPHRVSMPGGYQGGAMKSNCAGTRG
jgi:DNA invertase Pin-like site-specific DNA recombinase